MIDLRLLIWQSEIRIGSVFAGHKEASIKRFGHIGDLQALDSVQASRKAPGKGLPTSLAVVRFFHGLLCRISDRITLVIAS